MKIYSNDPLVHYKDSTIDPIRTKEQIDALLRAFKVTDIHWHYDPAKFDIFVQFGIEETIENMPIKVVARVACPIIWDQGRKRNQYASSRGEDTINLNVGMRAMYWYIKTHLETTYAMQSNRVAGFLPNIITHGGKTIEQSLANLRQVAALPERIESVEPEIIQPKADHVGSHPA